MSNLTSQRSVQATAREDTNGNKVGKNFAKDFKSGHPVHPYQYFAHMIQGLLTQNPAAELASTTKTLHPLNPHSVRTQGKRGEMEMEQMILQAE